MNTIRMLYFVRESYPTPRVDIEVLFGAELVRRGHKIDLVMQAADRRTLPGPQDWFGCTVWVGPTDDRDGAFARARKHWLSLLHDLRLLLRAGPDRYPSIQVRDKFLTAALALLAARLRGQKFFYWLSYPQPEALLRAARERTARYPAVSLVRGLLSKWLLYRWILRHCDHAFVQSEQMKRDVCALGASPHKITPVPMGVPARDVVSDSAMASRPPAASAELQIAYLGVINQLRRLDMLVDMLALLRDRGLSARLVFVGDGEKASDRERIERRAHELGIASQVHVTGFLPRAEALQCVQAADIAVSPFYPEPELLSTSPTKLVEYLALGIPVVANDHPEQRLVLRESKAGVCVPWGARHFARAVTWLAGRDLAARRAMGDRGRRWVLAHRTYARIADDVERTYLEQLS